MSTNVCRLQIKTKSSFRCNQQINTSSKEQIKDQIVYRDIFVIKVPLSISLNVNMQLYFCRGMCDPFRGSELPGSKVPAHHHNQPDLSGGG